MILLKDFDIKNANFKFKKNSFFLQLDYLNNGINNFDNFIVSADIKTGTMKIYDRICDHHGGRLISKQNKIVCPLHNWQFDPITGKYINVGKKKHHCTPEK